MRNWWKITRWRNKVNCAVCKYFNIFSFFQLGKQKKKFMPYNYQHKYFICEYPLKPWVHFLPHKIRVFKDIPIEVRAPGSFLHIKEGPCGEELPLKSLGYEMQMGVCQTEGRERWGRNGEVMRRKEEEIMWMHGGSYEGKTAFFLPLERRIIFMMQWNDKCLSLSVPSFSAGPTCPRTLLPADNILLCNQEEKVVGKHCFPVWKTPKMSLFHLHLLLVRWLEVREKKG